MECRLPGSSVHEIFQARILEWVAIHRCISVHRSVNKEIHRYVYAHKGFKGLDKWYLFIKGTAWSM